MRKISFILICMVLLLKASSQVTNADFFTKCVDSIYQDFRATSETDYKYMSQADSLIISVFQLNDTDLTNAVYKFTNFRDSILSEAGFDVDDSRYESQFRNHCLNYCIFQKLYINLNYDDQIATILSENSLGILDYLPISSDTNFLKSLLTDSVKLKRFYAYQRLFQIMDTISLTEFYLRHASCFRLDKDLYSRILSDVMLHGKPSKSIMSGEEPYYINLFDTSDYYNKKYYNYYFKNDINPSSYWSDSTYYANYPENARKLEEWIQQKKLEDLEYKRVNDSINVATIYDRFPIYWKHAYSDTTLWLGNGSVPVLEADDGMRFDTFPTEVLIGIIDTINFHSVYDTMQDGLDLNQSVTVIHLRKIFQLLGDRNAYRLFDPDSTQAQIINRWIDDYRDMVCNDSIGDKQSEANYQLLRMWRLLYPRFKDWLVNHQDCRDITGYTGKYLHTMATENIVTQMIAEADQYYANGENSKMYAIAYYLKDIWRDVVIHPSLVLPRRPVRGPVESQRWVDDYIYPSLKRWHIPGVE